jgi:hypothetical protein
MALANQPSPRDTDLPDAIVQLFAQRQTYRDNATAEAWNALTEREQALVKDAAVMGWVQGMRHHDLKYPGDRQVVPIVIEACLAFADLYPAISNYQPAEED